MEDTGSVHSQPQVGSRRRQRSTIWLGRVLIALAVAVLALVVLISVQPIVVLIISRDTAGGVAYLADGSSALIPPGTSLRVISSPRKQDTDIKFRCLNPLGSEIHGAGYFSPILMDIVFIEISGCELKIIYHFSPP